MDGVGDIEQPVIVDVGGVLARQRNRPEQIIEREDRIGDVDGAVGVDISTNKETFLAGIEDSVAVDVAGTSDQLTTVQLTVVVAIEGWILLHITGVRIAVSIAIGGDEQIPVNQIWLASVGADGIEVSILVEISQLDVMGEQVK